MSHTLGFQSSSRRAKRNVLVIAVLLTVALGVFFGSTDNTILPRGAIRIAYLISSSLLILAWCYYDSLEHKQTLYPWFRILIVIFGLCALFIYLFKSRGFKGGLYSSGMALLFLMGLLVILSLSVLLSTLVFGVA